MTEQELLRLISVGKKREVKKEEVFSKEVDINNLKKIDKIFNKGLSYYLDPKTPSESKEASIFFRKKEFNSELNLQAKKIVNGFEELKLSLSALATLSNMSLNRTVQIYTVNHSAKECAKEMHKQIYPTHFPNTQKEFLVALINKLSAFNIYVFEFVEAWNQKDKANIDGVFLAPNAIVLRRQEGSSYRREIFTLMHEFGHYLLNIEEVDKLNYDVLGQHNLSDIEQWCNDFAFYFLIGEHETVFNDLPVATARNDYNHELISQISSRTYLSEIALFTRLLFNNKISQENYAKVKREAEEKYKAYQEEQKRKRELEKAAGKEPGGSAKVPIKSDLLISTVQSAFYEGVIDEYQVCKTLNIKPDKIDKYLQW